jgi:hypothetical protein
MPVVVAFVMGLGKYFDKLGRRLKLGLAVYGEIRTCIDLFLFFCIMKILLPWGTLILRMKIMKLS